MKSITIAAVPRARGDEPPLVPSGKTWGGSVQTCDDPGLPPGWYPRSCRGHDAQERLGHDRRALLGLVFDQLFAAVCPAESQLQRIAARAVGRRQMRVPPSAHADLFAGSPRVRNTSIQCVGTAAYSSNTSTVSITRDADTQLWAVKAPCHSNEKPPDMST